MGVAKAGAVGIARSAAVLGFSGMSVAIYIYIYIYNAAKLVR